MAFDARISILTLGVANVKTSTEFYERLGWRRSKTASNDSISFFRLDEMVFALYPRDALAEDAGFEDATPPQLFKNATLSQNHLSCDDVDTALKIALRAGARLTRPAKQMAWGGYAGCFAAPDGHVWEMAYNPMLTMDSKGALHLPA